MAPCALVAALFVVTAALLQLAAHLPDAAAAGGTDDDAILLRNSAVEGAGGAGSAGGAEGMACVQGTGAPRVHRGESGEGCPGVPLKTAEIARTTAAMRGSGPGGRATASCVCARC
jgi:hypothetical protein